MEADKSLYMASVCLQTYLLFIVAKDYLISIGYFRRTDRDAFILVILTHYFSSCLDIVLVTLILIWVTFAMFSEKAQVLLDANVCPGGQSFVTATTANIVLAQAFVLSHIIALPVFLCCMQRKPALREMF